MQYILDEKDMTKLKSTSFVEGFNKAVSMINGGGSHVVSYKVSLEGKLETEHYDYNHGLKLLNTRFIKLEEFERNNK